LPVTKEKPSQKIPFLVRVERFFSSLKLALILILILVGLCLVGAFLIQIPASYTQNPDMYAYWMENVAQPSTGPWFGMLKLLGLFNVFHSVWFLAAGALLIISIIVCTFNRWNQIKAGISRKPLPKADSYIKNTENKIVLSSDLNSNAIRERILKVFLKNRYTVKESDLKSGTYIAGDKNRFSPLGTYLIHLSFVLFIIGFIIGSYLGFQEPSFMVAEGETKPVGYGTQLSLRLDWFKDEYWDNGSPRDYSSQVAIYDNGEIVKQGVVQVNHPMIYEGIRFYQSFFGGTVILEIKDVQDKVVYQGNVLLSQTVDNHPYVRPAGSLQLNEPQFKVYVIGRASNMEDADLAENQVAVQVYRDESSEPVVSTILTRGVPFKNDQINILYSGQAKYSGFQVSRDPGIALIWIASSLFILGLIMVFYLPRRQILALVEPDSSGAVKLYLAPGPGRKTGTASNLQRLVDDLKPEIKLEEKLSRKEKSR
jgi:cytochrome c biogenesis protein